MSKIIQVSPDKVAIGLDNGGIREVPTTALNFNPKVGMLVEIYENGTQLVVTPSGIAQPASNGRKVNKIAYILLALFLGRFGAHKFYAGHMILGIVYLLLCWTFIPGFIAFIEMIIALFKTSDANGMIEA
ncbi:MAG: TM2 domain-containing protein [Succinivibrio sp.]